MGKQLKEFLDNGYVNIIGGCCGTTPDHIKEFVRLARDTRPRKILAPKESLQLSGM